MSAPDELDLPPLDPEVASLIASARRPTAIPDDARASLERLLAPQLGMIPAAAAGQAASSSASTAATSSSIARVARGLAIFVAGGAAGVGIHAATSRAPAPEVRYVDRVVSVSVASPASEALVVSTVVPSIASASSTPSAPMLPIKPSVVPVASSAAPAGPDSELARERALIEVERAALARGDAPSALAAAAAHAKEFPAGQMSEQREALAIQALVLSGQYDAARARGAQFHARFPHGLFAPVVDAALAKIP